MSKRNNNNNNNKTLDGKQGDQEVQLLLRPDLELVVLPEPLQGVLGSLCCSRFCCMPGISWRSGGETTGGWLREHRLLEMAL